MYRFTSHAASVLSIIVCLVASVSAQSLTEQIETDILSSAPVPPPAQQGEDWPRFLGPQETGHSSETGLLVKWPKQGPSILWKKDVGTGYSAPSVRGNRLVIHHRPGRHEIIECCRADTGESLWKTSYPTKYTDPYGYNNGPRCSPILTDNHCYTYGAEDLSAQNSKQESSSGREMSRKISKYRTRFLVSVAHRSWKEIC